MNQIVNPAEVLEMYDKVAAEESGKGLSEFLKYVVIDSRPPRKWDSLLQSNPWQQRLLDMLMPLFELATGHRSRFKERGCFVTAPRGCGKTSTLALLACWALKFSKGPLQICAAAADKEQAQILVDRCRLEAEHNPWLKDGLVFERGKVKGPKGELTTLSSDAPSSSGLLADIYLIDELTWHKKPDLFNILYSGRHKRPDGIYIIISNAGEIGSWQHNFWKFAEKSDFWSTHEIPAFSANWLDRSQIEEDRKALPPSLYKRLHENKWVLPGEDNQFVTRAQVEGCFYARQSESPPSKDNEHVIEIDYGITQDRTALAVMHMEENTVHLDRLLCWQGSKEDRVKVEKIEEWIDQMRKEFNVVRVVMDVYQLEALAQKLEREGAVVVERINFGGGMKTKLSENLRSLILNNRLVLYPRAGVLALPDGKDEDLVDELEALVIVERAAGWHADHQPGGHDDRFIVLALGAYTLVRLSELITARVEIVGNEDPGTYEEDIPWGMSAQRF